MFDLQNKKDRMYLAMGLSDLLIASVHIGVTEGTKSWDEVTFVGAEKPTYEVAVAVFTEYKAKMELADLRRVRNMLIAETDWWMLPDCKPTGAQVMYRQALRDITNTYQSLDTVIWPIKP